MPNPNEAHQRKPSASGHSTPSGLTDEEIKRILAGDGRTIAETAERLAEELQRLKSAQIRNFYGPMTKIRESKGNPEAKLNRLQLMRPRLVYMRSREPKAEPLQRDFEKLITKAQATEESLGGIFDYAEAVVGYHRKHQK